ncbi:hypothetical protein ABT160_31390 [Streptomyces sp. NPDC001941]|uniref:hypothetical protein n=1 Tax=Streptomyces sp. NPDC001941 TaxID=3154659 RepID=UPI00332D8463
MSDDQQYPYDPYATQTWQGQTWDTQYQPPVPEADAERTAYLPPQNSGAQPLPPEQPHDPYAAQDGRSYGQQATGEQPYGSYGGQQPSYGGAQPGTDGSYGYGQQAAGYAEPYHQDPYAAPAPEAYAPAEPTPYAQAAADAAPYGAPVTTGHARVTDAQRARAEGRSPIIDPGLRPAALTAVLGLLLAGGAALGQYALLVPLVLLQAVTAAGWFRLNGMWPARQGIALAFAGGLTADIALLAAGRANAPAAILGTLGVWVLLSLVLQMRSHAEPDERMYGLMATVTSAALAVVATGWLAADPDAVVVGALGVAAATVARALPLPGVASVAVALLAGAGAGIAAGGATGLGASGALLGAAAGGCALIGLRVAAYDYPSKFVHMTAGVALPLAAAAPAAYLLGRALV